MIRVFDFSSSSLFQESATFASRLSVSQVFPIIRAVMESPSLLIKLLYLSACHHSINHLNHQRNQNQPIAIGEPVFPED